MPHTQGRDRLRISLFGQFQVWIDDRSVTDFQADSARGLLAYLAAHAGVALRRDVLATLLCPERPTREASQVLRQALHRLRRSLGPLRDCVEADNKSVCFVPPASAVLDFVRFTDLIQACRRHGHRRLSSCARCMGRLQEAAELYQGPFLHGFTLNSTLFDEWTVMLRERYHQNALWALYHLAQHFEQRGEYPQALAYARRQIALDAWREEAHQQAMRCLALDGQRSAALAQYIVCRRTLRSELGVEPSYETRALYETIRSGQDAIAALRPPLHLHNLPPLATPLVDREQEMGQLAALLQDPDVRLLALVGPGGIGKTRLATAVARKAIGTFLDGIYFIPLTSVVAPEFLPSLIAQTLGFSLFGGQSAASQIVDYLCEREMCLIFDAYEHMPQVGGLITQIVHGAPRVSAIVTSRQRPGLPGEWLLDVGGLAYPEDDGPAAPDLPAVTLFHQVAHRVMADFAPGPEEERAIHRICRYVEGMPLAIELAAGWLRVLSPSAIADEIERSPDFLAARTGLPDRHRSLKVVFDYSFHLLDPEQQRVLLRLSVFEGGFTREAAECVCGASLAQLSALVDKSLIRYDRAGRYGFHELLRQCARERLRGGEEEEALRQHYRSFARMCAGLEDRLIGPEKQAALASIEADIENIRVGWCRAVRARDWEALDDYLAAVQSYHVSTSLFPEWRRLLELANAEMADQTIAPSSVSIAPTLARFSGRLLGCYGYLLLRSGDYTGARSNLERAFERLRHSGQSGEAARSLYNLGLLAIIEGEYERAQALCQEAMALSNAAGDRWALGMAYNHLGLATRMREQYAEAEQAFNRALSILSDVGESQGIAYCLSNLGVVATKTGEHEEAIRYYEDALAICEETEDRWDRASCLNSIAYASLALGRRSTASDYFRRSLRQAIAINAVPLVLNTLLGLADLYLQQGQSRRAAFLLRYVLGHPVSYAHTRAEARALMAHNDLTLAPHEERRGAPLTLAEVVASELYEPAA